MRRLCLIACFLISSGASLPASEFRMFFADSVGDSVLIGEPAPAEIGLDEVLISPEPPAPGSLENTEELIHPPLPRPDRPSVTTLPPSSGGIVDLRPPELSLDAPWIEVEPSWLNDVIDDHILIWQSVTDSITTVPRGGSDFGITTWGLKLSLTGEQGPIWVQGVFAWNFLSGPSTAAVPARTYDLGVEFNYSRKLNDVWGVALSVTPLFSTDFHNHSSDSFRLTAGGLLSYQADEVTRLVAGLTFLDRPDLPFIPIAGIKWMVTENVEMDILVPRPKVAWRFDRNEEREAWLYTGGEIGGGSWAIEREGNVDDRMGYRDLRLVFGVESRQVSGSRRVLEAGYVFDRKVSFERGSGDERLGSTFVFRWGRLY